MSLIEAEKALAKDPVCGMSVDPATAKASAEYEGRTYYFCCAGCRTKFLAEPARFVVAESDADAPASAHFHAGGGRSHGAVCGGQGPGLRHECRSDDDEAQGRSRGAAYYFCSALSGKVRRRADEVRRAATGEAGGSGGGRHLHLSDAPRDTAVGPGRLPDLRHGAGARGAVPRNGAEPRTRRHDAAVLDRPCARRPRRRLEMAGHLPGVRARRPQSSNWVQFALATPVVLWAGWPFFDRGVGLPPHAQPQHVHADRDRDRRRLALQRGRDRRARRVSAGVPRRGGSCAGLFRGGGGHHRAGAARPGPGAARTGANGRGDPGPARPGAEDRPPPRGRRDRGRCAARSRRGRRPPARAARGQGPGRRRDRARVAAPSTNSMVTGESMPVAKARASGSSPAR